MDKANHKPRTRPNGAGTAIKRGKTWTARVVIGWKLSDDEVPKKQAIYRTKGGFAKKKDALKYCDVLLSGPKVKKPLTLRQIYDAWLPTHEDKVSKSTMNCYKAAWKHFGPIHNMNMADINVDDLQECLDECSKGKRTKENMKALAGLLMKYAIPRHQTDMNYAEFLHTGTDEKGTHPAFTKEQVELIREQIGKVPHAEDVYCLIYTGMRPSEMLNLTPNDVDNNVFRGGAKTQAGKDRAVPISPRIACIISEKLTKNKEYIFSKDDGTKMSANYFRDTYFYNVLAAAGIQPLPTPDKPAHYVPYSCRHTFANMLKNVEGADKDKAALMGHEDYDTTKRHYQSSELEALKAIIEKL